MIRGSSLRMNSFVVAYNAESVPIVETSRETLLPNGKAWLPNLWLQIFLRLEDSKLFRFFAATKAQTELDEIQLKAAISRVDEALARKKHAA